MDSTLNLKESTLKIEDILLQVRGKLQNEGVKLWLKPYYIEDVGCCTLELKGLAERYSKELDLPYNSCYAALSELQDNALEKLKHRDRFNQSGLATFKIKVVIPNAPAKIITKEILLSINGSELRRVIIDEVNLPINSRLKIICNGKIISANESLEQQKIKLGQLILAIVLSESIDEAKANENSVIELETIRNDTKMLANADDQYLQLEDQAGNAILIPNKEKKALILAMTLHEKGRAALKKNDYARALIFFLDADKEFNQCNSRLLNSVDNYALLNLDIAWCYLNLQSFKHLPESQDRLKKCEEKFLNTYGPNLERLMAVKGTIGNEAALFMRLHLLQAIVQYHQNNRGEALTLLKKAQSEMKSLKVDEESLRLVVEQGFSIAEARLGLRATGGNRDQAVEYILENRKNRVASRRKAAAERILHREKIKLGKCADGKQFVEPMYVRSLVRMGFGREAARIALQQCNNNISESVQYISENPMPGPSQTKSREFLSFLDDLLPELVSAGFDVRMAKLALKKHDGDITKAAEDLLDNNGVIEGNLDEISDIDLTGQNKKEKLERDEAFARLSEDISMVDDDHLDLTLEKEEEFLLQYLSLLQKENGKETDQA